MVRTPRLYGYARPEQVIVAALTALLTSLGVVSCI